MEQITKTKAVHEEFVSAYGMIEELIDLLKGYMSLTYGEDSKRLEWLLDEQIDNYEYCGCLDGFERFHGRALERIKEIQETRKEKEKNAQSDN
jgi:hypothetical protein